MHRKILLRAAELVAMGWTTGAGARSAGDARVRGTNPIAVSWCLTGAVFRALFEIVGLDGYEGREASIVDSVKFWRNVPESISSLFSLSNRKPSCLSHHSLQTTLPLFQFEFRSHQLRSVSVLHLLCLHTVALGMFNANPRGY